MYITHSSSLIHTLYRVYLLSLPSTFYRTKLLSAVLQVCKAAMKFKPIENCWNWLCVLPLCHFLSGACKPFISLEYKLEKSHFYARAEKFGYNAIKPKLSPG